MAAHPEITHVSRDRGAEYASAATTGAAQAIQVADRFYVCKNLSEAVQRLLARVLSQLKAESQETGEKARHLEIRGGGDKVEGIGNLAVYFCKEHFRMLMPRFIEFGYLRYAIRTNDGPSESQQQEQE